jgi:hypothetical protein
MGKIKERRPIMLKLTSNIKKQTLLKARDKLRANGFDISADRSKEEREIYKKILPQIIKYRKEGKKVMVKNDKLIVNGKAFLINNLENVEMQFKRKREEELEEMGNGKKGGQSCKTEKVYIQEVLSH